MAVPQSATAFNISARDKELLKDIKRCIKESNQTIATGGANPETSSKQLEDRSRNILLEFENETGVTDVVATLGIFMASRERPVAEVLLEYVVKRGVKMISNDFSIAAANEYAYGVAGIQLTLLQYQDRKWNLATQALIHVGTEFRSHCSHLDRRGNEKHGHLFDLFLILQARAAFCFSEHIPNGIPGKPHEEALRQLSQMTAHKLVMDVQNYAIVSVLKAAAQIQQGQLSDAYNTLQRHGLQERALREIGTITNQEEPESTSGSPKAAFSRKHSAAATTGYSTSPHSSLSKTSTRASFAGTTLKERHKSELSIGEPKTMLHLCHDMHLYVAIKLDKMDDVKELFEEYRADYKRGCKLDPFVKHITTHVDIQKMCQSFLLDWTLDHEHLHNLCSEVKC
jgi:hypothetical protein